MLSWASLHLRRASFRGVPFEVTATTDEVGRKVAVHGYPLKDLSYPEDLGRADDRYQIRALLVGTDVLARVKALKAALTTAGPGPLVHPWLGTVSVTVIGDAKIEWEDRANRVARVDFTCLRTPVAGPPQATASKLASLFGAVGRAIGSVVAAVKDAIAGPLAAIQSLYAEVSATVAEIAAVVQDAVAVVGLVRSAINDPLGTALGLLGGLTEGAGFEGAIDLAVGLYDLCTAIGSLANGWGDTAWSADSSPAAVRALAEGGEPAPAMLRPATTDAPANDPARVVEALLRVAAMECARPPVPLTTPSRRDQAQIREDIITLVRTAAAIEATRLVPRITWTSRAQADDVRTRLAASLGDAADRAGARGWHGAWRGLTQLRAEAVRELLRAAARLPEITTLTLLAPVPAVALAWRLYGDRPALVLARRTDLLARNPSVIHPAALPAGRPLEVLVDG